MSAERQEPAENEGRGEAGQIGAKEGRPTSSGVEFIPPPLSNERPSELLVGAVAVPVGEAPSPLRELAIRARATRTAWLEQHGVPISNEFAQFAEAVGELIERCERGDASPSVPPQFDWLAKLAEEIEHTIFFREIDVLETDIPSLKHAIANLVRSKTFAAPPAAEPDTKEKL